MIPLLGKKELAASGGGVSLDMNVILMVSGVVIVQVSLGNQGLSFPCSQIWRRRGGHASPAGGMGGDLEDDSGGYRYCTCKIRTAGQDMVIQEGEIVCPAWGECHPR